MRMLIIEDKVERRADFRRRFAEHHIDFAWDYVGATTTIQGNPPYDIMYFDYHLGGEKGKGKARNGADIAKYMVDNVAKEKWPAYAVVHTDDLQGAKVIYAILSFAGVPVRIETFK